MRRYNPSEIEPKWQKIWEDKKTFEAEDFSDKPKYYSAGQFPGISGAGLHVGHTRVFSITDAMARYKRQSGFNVLNPIGWDAFGLPVENYAIKSGMSPQKMMEEKVPDFRNQLKRLGVSFDWSREIDTTKPEYYKWTQWIFKKLYERGLAYRAENYQWFCANDKTVLANEQVENGKCWRCGCEVEKRKMKQWFFKITEYADRLLEDIETLDWPESVKTAQRNWIGKKTGINITYKSTNAKTEEEITVFTTRPDTNFGATFVVLAPEHELVEKMMSGELKLTDNEIAKEAIGAYVKKAMAKSEIERQEDGRKKTGVFTGLKLRNDLTGEDMPVWISDFVLAGFGTGALVGVPGHDLRDFEFAKQFDLPIVRVVVGSDGDESPIKDAKQVQEEEGVMINSGFLDGMDIHEATEKVMDYMEENGMGERTVQYKMRDWLISRQRYWGAPIPVAYDASGEVHLIDGEDLPVLLPEIDDYHTDDSGRSALAKDKDFLNVKINGQEMERETDTMDGFACSSWYLIRYCDPHNNKEAWDPKKANYWNPVDFYVGGEHSTTHMLYVRFWTMVFKDLGLTDFSEPIQKFLKNGQVLAEDGRKMSKSLGNTIDPLTVIDQGYGADALRTYILFMAPPDGDTAWSTRGLGGVHRFLNRVWTLVQEYDADKKIENSKLKQITPKMVKKVSQDLEKDQFNTAIAGMMEAINEYYLVKNDGVCGEAWKESLGALARCLAPFAPHMACECFEILGFKESIEDAGWPTWNEEDLVADEVELVVQVNGKLRGKTMVGVAILEDVKKVEEIALDIENVKAFIGDTKIKKVIVIAKNKLVNIVI